MQIAMVGLGRMGANMVRRLLCDKHDCVVHDRDSQARRALEQAGATGAASLDELVSRLARPRVVWLMLPAAAVDATLASLAPLLDSGDTIVDGGNSHHRDDVRRAAGLAGRGIHFVDVGTSGGVWGFENGYCLMVGGEVAAVRRLEPVFASLAPRFDSVARAPGRGGAPLGAERGFLHCGPNGAGHFVKMVHNGIEYGLMAAYAEGFNLLRGASAAAGAANAAADAETAPSTHPQEPRYAFDLAEIAELWRRGSVVRSWLLDLTADALRNEPDLESLRGHVADSGEGRWMLQAAIDGGVPAPVLATALFARFASRDADDFANRVLSAMRREFGGHLERATGPEES
ncbi:MAG: decarboxylating 6-phosphogluconate dehydrogenase [Burkholderiaceae bacterium]|nr:decarboxylating 6-phosphogluconate dehydrogenase [Burkholderiaceae bacterium]